MKRNLCIGLDFGTDSVRAVLVDTSNGQTISTSIAEYPRWKNGQYCNPEKYQFRQHPLDHLESLESAISSVISDQNVEVHEIRGLCIDTTGSSPVPVDKDGTPLALSSKFSENENAMVVLWKDHTAIKEAEEINNLARTWGGVDFTKYSGGIYSSEWFWAKILHIIRLDDEVRNHAYSWMEHCDLMTFLLTGGNDIDSFHRSRCAAGHKAMWHESWGGYPSAEFLTKLNPYLGNLANTLPKETYTSDQPAGHLSAKWAAKLGLTTDVIISVGILDAHAGAVGSGIEEGTLVKVMGTSTCDMIVDKKDDVGDKLIRGISGQVDGSIIPGMIGFEAGQSAFGDVLDWFKRLLSWPMDQLIDGDKEAWVSEILNALTVQAQKIPYDKSAMLSLDWINGRRTPDANQLLKGAITNIGIGTDAPMIYKSLVEGICYGARRIIERFLEEGVEIKSIVGIGGVANKSPFIMQTLADILNMPIKIVASEQTAGLGAAMFASVAAQVFPTIQEAINHMGQGFRQTYYPNEDRVAYYDSIYQQYLDLGNFVENHLTKSLLQESVTN